MQFESEQTTTGWGSISSFPVAGTTNNNNDVPIYNFPLGVWNLKKISSNNQKCRRRNRNVL